MEKQTKQTLKVLSTLALASGVVLGNGGTADAKSYKPEVRYDGKDYFVKTSDPGAVGKNIYFTTEPSKTYESKSQIAVVYDYANYNGEELNISWAFKTGSTEETFTRDTPFSIVDDEIPYAGRDNEETMAKKEKDFVASAKSGFTTVNKLNKVEKPTESTQPVQPAGPEQPVQPTGSTQPVQPAGPEQPVQPTGSTQPVQPAGPKQPVQPAEPAQPAQPKKSALSEIAGAGEAQNNPKGGQLETPNKDDKKVESTIKSEGNVNAKKALPNTGLQTSSYALLGSIIGLVSIMALRRKNSN